MRLKSIIILFVFGLSFPYLWFRFLSVVTSSWQYSYFYVPNVEAVNNNFRSREVAAIKTLTDTAKTATLKGQPWHANATCVTVLCAERPVQYINQVVASLLRALIRSHPECLLHSSKCPVQLLLLDTTNGKIEQLSSGSLVESIIPIFRCENCTSNSLTWEKLEILHYALALNMSYQHGCASITLLEDDTIVAPDFFERLKLTMSKFDHDHWAVVKFFQTDYWRNWENSDAFLLVVVPLAISTLIFVVLSRIFPRVRLRRCLVISFILYLATIGVLTLWLIGKQYTFRTRIHAFSVATDCAGTPANFYTRENAFLLSQFLFGTRIAKPVDLLLCDFVAGIGRNIVVFPGTVQHIGLVSSSPNKRFKIDARIIHSKLDPDFQDPDFRWE